MISRLLAYAQLLRISNTLTAVADVWMGMLVALAVRLQLVPLSPREMLGAGLITLASSLLYHAGMVLNDVFDAEQDAVLRPTRPIPRGEITWKLSLIHI